MDIEGANVKTFAPKFGGAFEITVFVDTKSSWRALKSPSLFPASSTFGLAVQVKAIVPVEDKTTLLKIT